MQLRRRASLVAVAVTAITGGHAFTTPSQCNSNVATRRTSALAADALAHFMTEAAEAVDEMERTAHRAEAMEVEALRMEARALEEEALALEREAAALEEEDASAVADALDVRATLEANEALEALTTPGGDNSKAEAEEAAQPASAVATEIKSRQVREGVENRAARRMSLRERLGQIDAQVAEVKGAASPAASSRKQEPEEKVPTRSMSLRELVSMK